MGCGCKGTKSTIGSISADTSTTKINEIGKYIIRSFAFLLSLILIPFILGVSVWVLFKTIVLNKDLDITQLLSALTKTIKKANEEVTQEVK